LKRFLKTAQRVIGIANIDEHNAKIHFGAHFLGEGQSSEELLSSCSESLKPRW
jgi:cob(I)alamin adenosyltransferase